MRSLISVLLFLILGLNSRSQDCLPLELGVYADWKELNNPVISVDGTKVAYELAPQKGDRKLIVYDSEKQTYDTLERGFNASFMADSKVLIYKIAPPYLLIRKQQLDGVKKEKQHKDSLGILFFEKDTIMKFQDVNTFKFSIKGGSLVAWMHDENFKPKADTVSQDSTSKTKPEKKKAKAKTKTSFFQVFDVVSGKLQSYNDISEFEVSDFGDVLSFVKQTNDSIDSVFVFKYHSSLEFPQQIFEGKGVVKNISFDEIGSQIAFLYSADTSKRQIFSLGFMGQKDSRAKIVADSTHGSLPRNWTASEHFKPKFSEDGTALYFGIAPKPISRLKDTLTADEKVSVDIWNWKDGQLQTQQLKNREREQKRTFLAVYYPKQNKLIPLASEEIPEVRPDYKLHRNFMIGSNGKPYEHLSSWEQTRYADLFLVNRTAGTSKLLLKKVNSFFSLSPSADYLLFYNTSDSSWYSMQTRDQSQRKLTTNSSDIFYNKENDIPKEAGPYGFAGWLDGDKAIVYSRYNLWLLDLKSNKAAPLIEDTEAKRYRYITLDKDEALLSDLIYLSVFDEKTKQTGFASFDVNSKKITPLLHGEARFSGLMKAKNENMFLFRKERFDLYPDLYLAKSDFANPVQMSEANPQQKNYCWGSVQLVEWQSFNAEPLEGLLYFPANFSSDSTYPMVVYFYETHSHDLYRHITPRPSRSVINISEYTSRGYFVFTPDIVYEDARPGQSAYNSVISGTQSLLERYPQIDKKRLGLQGQSWGGYQIAWLITRTNLFGAAMAGAPVSNMTSAYGGIRWESGVVRAFQYEEGQSRIGGSLWEKLPDYIENSPLFFADRVQTPLLIMSNDADGAVPWYQGIEYFTALRRLGKPVWMLNYNNGPHNLTRRADMEDLTVRLQQFFDYYLKGSPEPIWMKTGIKAVDKGIKTGFEWAEEHRTD
ncbi:MAG: S9 family peptidase [Bacteroidetes bacterium]|nr:S9 family peptidase [Bacteroidota bacterium]